MVTEIGARDLADEQRYNMLEVRKLMIEMIRVRLDTTVKFLYPNLFHQGSTLVLEWGPLKDRKKL